MGHNGRVVKARDSTLALTRVIEPTEGPGSELASLADAGRVS